MFLVFFSLLMQLRGAANEKIKMFNLCKYGKNPSNMKAREANDRGMRSSPCESEGQSLTLFKCFLDPETAVTKFDLHQRIHVI